VTKPFEVFDRRRLPALRNSYVMRDAKCARSFFQQRLQRFEQQL
jgi:hypothetical protein